MKKEIKKIEFVSLPNSQLDSDIYSIVEKINEIIDIINPYFCGTVENEGLYTQSEVDSMLKEEREKILNEVKTYINGEYHDNMSMEEGEWDFGIGRINKKIEGLLNIKS